MITTNRQRSADETRSLNPDAFSVRIPRDIVRKAEYHVYIHSISKRSFPIRHFLFPKVTLKACGENERYTTVMSIPEPFVQVAPDEANGGRRGYSPDSAWRIAIDLLNPNNTTDDPYIKGNPAASIAANCDLVRQGIFPSLNAVPTEEELKRAEKARDDYYRGIADEALRLETLNQRAALDEMLNTNPDVRLALDHFGITTSFHKKYTATQACPKCGEQVKQGVAFHVIPGIGLCVIDWKGAVEAGIKSKADVPEEARWWEDEKRGPGRPPKAA